MVEKDTEIGATDNALEILSYLPAKKLQTFQTVCRDWLQLITSSYFVKLHLSKGIRSRVVMAQIFPARMIEYNNYDSQNRIQIPPQFSGCPVIMGSADGLIFMHDQASEEVNEHVVFNPSTGKCRGVRLSPPHHHTFKCSWFGNLADGEYAFVVLPFSKSAYRFETWVYKFAPGSGVMNRICSTPLSIVEHFFTALQDYGTMVQGVVYWPIKIEPMNMPSLQCKILGYRLQENKHVVISAPPGARSGNLRLGLFVDGCSLFATTFKIKSVVELWILKGGRPWTIYANIEIGKFNTMRCLGFFPNGDFIVDVDENRLVKYSFNRRESTLLMLHHSERDRVIMCADSLVSP